MLLTSAWTGTVKLWSVPACKEIKTVKGERSVRVWYWSCEELTLCDRVAHKERIGGVAWHPQATLSQSRTAANFATSGADNDVKIWGLDGFVLTVTLLPQFIAYAFTSFSHSDAPLQTLTGHSARVCRIGFHPSGKYLGSASFDGTWRLWDVERGGEELLLQEGHSKEVYAIAFQDDGALVCTGSVILRSRTNGAMSIQC